MERFFVTGGTGFLGKRFLAGLTRGMAAEVVCLARAGSDRPAPPTGGPPVRWVEGDMRRPEGFRGELAAGCTVVHLAARTGRARRHEMVEHNASGTAALVEACREVGVARIVFVSTIAVRFDELESYPYAASKAEAERAVRACGIPWTVVRPTVILGRSSPIWATMERSIRRRWILVPGGGRRRIQPIWVDDAAELLRRVVVDGGLDGEVIEAGGPRTLRLAELLLAARAVASPGSGGRVVALPLEWPRRLLALAERYLGILPPVTAGQLSLFANDAVAQPHPLVAELAPAMTGVDGMLDRLLRPGAG